jgi:hypothetical protein
MAFDCEPAILRLVPHRAPILRLCRVVTAAPTSAVVAGHEPAGPGALPWELGAIEGLAQAAAVLLAAPGSGTTTAAAPRGMLAAVKRFTVTEMPAAGAEIRYHVRLVRRFGPTALVVGHAEADGRQLAAGELTLWSDQGA